MPVRIGDLLLKEKRISAEQLQQALSHQKSNGGKLGFNLVKLGFVKDEEITALLSKQYGVPSIDLAQFEIDPLVIKLIPGDTAQKYQIVPVSRSGATLTIAMTDPTNVFAMDDIKFMTGYNVEPVVASESALEDSIEKDYGSTRALALLRETAPADAAPVVTLTNMLLVDSLKRGASDIHIEPYEKEFRVRFRIDGVLYNVMALPMKLKDPLTSRVKIMAKLDIAEKRLPQDGRIKIKMKVEDRSRDLDFRVSCLPTLWGEKIVLRLLDKSKLMLDMTKLGFEPHSLERFKNAISKPYGIVLVTGPTGSGKTNTL